MTPAELTRAIRRVGLGLVRTAALLAVDADQLRRWTDGTEPVPDHVAAEVEEWLEAAERRS